MYGSDAPYGKLLWPLVIFGHAHLHSRTDSQVLWAEYCIVGIPHKYSRLVFIGFNYFVLHIALLLFQHLSNRCQF